MSLALDSDNKQSGQEGTPVIPMLDATEDAREIFELWHEHCVHDFDSNCSCSRCEVIVDFLLEDWRDGRLTHESIAEWYHSTDMSYETFPTVIVFTNQLRSDRVSGEYQTFEMNASHPKFGEVFLYARTIGYSEA